MPLSTSIHPFLLGLLLLLPGVAPGETALPAPAITSIQLAGTNLVVVVSVPAGIRKVTLEGRSRLERGTWVPRAVRRLDGSGGDVTFQLPGTEAVAVLRVRAARLYLRSSGFCAGVTQVADP